MYNPFYDSEVPFGNQSSCAFNAEPNPNLGDRINKYSSICAAEKKGSLDDVGVVFITITVMGVLLGVLLVLISIYLRYQWIRKDYNDLNNN